MAQVNDEGKVSLPARTRYRMARNLAGGGKGGKVVVKHCYGILLSVVRRAVRVAVTPMMIEDRQCARVGGKRQRHRQRDTRELDFKARERESRRDGDSGQRNLPAPLFTPSKQASPTK